MPQNNAHEAHFNERSTAPDPPTHSEDGVDLTLIRWMLSMTPAERLQTLQQDVTSILRLRHDQAED